MRTRLSLALLAALLLAPPANARDTRGETGAAPAKNFSNIHSDTDWIEKAFARAEIAIGDGDWTTAVRTLQPIVDQRTSREVPGDAAPYVRTVYGTSVYEGAWIVARHRVLRGGDEAVAAYESEYGATARDLLAVASKRRDPALLRDVAVRFLPSAAGRRAALLLVDAALERADVDAAFEWLEALEDVEAVSTESKAQLAPWREARIRRQARALARDDAAFPKVSEALASANPADGVSIDAVPATLRRRPAPPRAWHTTGGDGSRAAVPAGLGANFRLRWVREPSQDDDLTDSVDPQREEHDRPSLWLPPRAAATEKHVFVSDGQYLHIYDLATGARVFERDATEYRDVRPGGIGEDGPLDRRLRFGLLEGHALTLHPVAALRRSGDGAADDALPPGHLVLAAVPDGDSWRWDRARSEAGHPPRDDHLEAYHWDGKRLRFLWRAGGYTALDEEELLAAGGLPDDTRLYGAPAVYRGRVWIAGIRPAKATQDRWEVWLYGLDPATGRAEVKTHLGTGTPLRTGRMDEVIPTSPAAAHGRVVVSTALGILAAVDASDGRVQWVHRYSRNVETERGRRRNRDSRDRGLRTRSFANEPPVLALDRCFVAPTDSNLVLTLFNRPRTAGRQLVARDPDLYNVGWKFMPEQIAGVVPPRGEHPSALVLVGKGEGGARPGSIVVVREAVVGERGLLWPRTDKPDPRGAEVWRGISPTGFGAEPYGRALVTAEEVFVPQAHGIAVFELVDRNGDGSHYLGVLNREDMGAKDAPERPYGNLIPIPGRGLLAVSATTIAFWERL